MTLLAVFTTLPSREQARRLATLLVERQLVACAQISEIESVYRWDGAVQQEREFRLMLKAPEARYEAIKATILAEHSYALPAIHALRLDSVHEPYGAWIEAACPG